MGTASAARPPGAVDLAFSPGLTELLARARCQRGRWAVAVTVLVTWAPLLLLSIVQAAALGDDVVLSFLRDLVPHTRALVAIPLLLVGTRFAERRLAEGVDLFERGGLVGDAARPPFRDAARRAAAVVRSPRADLAILVAAVASSALFPELALERPGGWRTTPDGRLTMAGAWLAGFVVPLQRFLLLHWALRLAAWCALLARVARLDLRLVASHPDRAGGLAFVGAAQKAFVPLVVAAGALRAADLGNRLLGAELSLEALRRPVGIFVVAVLAVALAPLLAFTPALLALRRRALPEHDVFAAGCAAAFEAEWLRGAQRAGPSDALRVEVLQNMDSLRQVNEGVRRLKPVPLDGIDLLALALAALLPVLPLVLLALTPADLERLLRSVLA